MARIDVLMPVKNGADTIGSAIESVLAQSFRDLRLLVVDDGSTDATGEIAAAAAGRDPRVIVTRNPGKGLVDALNHGLSQSSAPFVARMDADDLSMERRLERQLEFMGENPGVAAVGSRCHLFGAQTGYPPALISPAQCREAIGLFTPLCHPSVVMRRDALARLETPCYSAQFPHAEDYELFSRLVLAGDLCNLDEPLLRYRIHAKQVSNVASETQRRSAFQISARHISDVYGIEKTATARIIAVMARKAACLGIGSWRESSRALRNALRVAYG